MATIQRAPRIEFLAEQEGDIAGDLEYALASDLFTNSAIERAYIARAGYDPASVPVVALCLYPPRAADAPLMHRIGVIFQRFFRSAPFIDVVLLDEQQVADVASVCTPFFERSGGMVSAK